MKYIILYRGEPVRTSIQPYQVLKQCLESVETFIVKPLVSHGHEIYKIATLINVEDERTIDTITNYVDDIRLLKQRTKGNQRDNTRRALGEICDMANSYYGVIVIRYDLLFKKMFCNTWFDCSEDIVFTNYESFADNRVCDHMFFIKLSVIERVRDLLLPQSSRCIHSLHHLSNSALVSGLTYKCILDFRAASGKDLNPLYNLARSLELTTHRNLHK